MGRRSPRPVEQIRGVERSPAKREVDSRYSARAKLRSCAWRRQGKGTCLWRISIHAAVGV